MARRAADLASRATPEANSASEHTGRVELRYVARAGLLPELSRQTYDSLYKALREAILNSLDAGASRVDVELSSMGSPRNVSVIDDGSGMSTREFCEQFMSLGGSGKFGEASRFGRIGIGSLALLQYATAAVIETKRAGTPFATRARIEHSWLFGRDDRQVHLDNLSAGFAEEYRYGGEPGDHFTRVQLEGVNEDVLEVITDPTRFYALVESLRRVLPLAWPRNRLSEALEAVSPELVAILEEHVAQWSAPVFVHSEWERDIELTRRSFGSDQAEVETWRTPPAPILKRLRVSDEGGTRTITVAGFLLGQERAQARWSGLTARVQNVAVEEHTFFDVTADPGFRKYITGEVWLFGDLDRERLINIDRSSFNRECRDYQAIQRFMGRAIIDFKTASVQRPQRQKVEIRRLLEGHRSIIRAVGRVAGMAAELRPGDRRGLPSSERSRGRLRDDLSLPEQLRVAGAKIRVDDEREADDLGYDLEMSGDGQSVQARVGTGLLEPKVLVGGAEYQIVFSSGGADDPPVLVRNRPRQIIFNAGHPAHAEGRRAGKYQLSLALELAYLLEESDVADGASVYERMVSFMEVL
jgi:hypothetical protein